MTTNKTIKVVAPADLNEGYTFEAVGQDSVRYVVTVPKGGVQAGQVMEVRVRADDDRPTSPAAVPFASVFDPTNMVGSTEDHETDEENNGNRVEQAVPVKPNAGTIPAAGKWKHGLFSCFQVFFHSSFWMAFCCQPVQVAQILTRMKLNMFGNPDSPAAVRRTMVGVMMVSILMLCLGNLWPFLSIPFAVYVVFIGGRARLAMRKHFRIGKGTTGTARWGDFCTMLFCGCCATIQMTRHTHEDHEYDALAPDGLFIDAEPVSVESSVIDSHEGSPTVVIDPVNADNVGGV